MFFIVIPFSFVCYVFRMCLGGKKGRNSLFHSSVEPAQNSFDLVIDCGDAGYSWVQGQSCRFTLRCSSSQDCLRWLAGFREHIAYAKKVNLHMIYICTFHVFIDLLWIYICKLHWNLNTMFVCQVNYI